VDRSSSLTGITVGLEFLRDFVEVWVVLSLPPSLNRRCSKAMEGTARRHGVHGGILLRFGVPSV
jgi:hypothetical protein